MKTANILGTEYKIIFDVANEEMPEDADGCMDQSTHIIKMAKLESDRNSVMDLDSYRKKVLRHEIIHAFYMNQACGIVVEARTVGEWMKR